MYPKFGGLKTNIVSSQSKLVTIQLPITDPPPIPSPKASLIVNIIVSPTGIQTCVRTVWPV